MLCAVSTRRPRPSSDPESDRTRRSRARRRRSWRWQPRRPRSRRRSRRRTQARRNLVKERTCAAQREISEIDTANHRFLNENHGHEDVIKTSYGTTSERASSVRNVPVRPCLVKLPVAAVLRAILDRRNPGFGPDPIARLAPAAAKSLKSSDFHAFFGQTLREGARKLLRHPKKLMGCTAELLGVDTRYKHLPNTFFYYTHHGWTRSEALTARPSQGAAPPKDTAPHTYPKVIKTADDCSDASSTWPRSPRDQPKPFTRIVLCMVV